MAQQTHGPFALDNLTYDLIAIMHEKSQAMEAYDKYHRDAQGEQKCAELINRIHQQDQRNVQELQQCLHERLQKTTQQKAA